jgi:hypothetical protein
VQVLYCLSHSKVFHSGCKNDSITNRNGELCSAQDVENGEALKLTGVDSGTKDDVNFNWLADLKIKFVQRGCQDCVGETEGVVWPECRKHD